MRSQRVIARRSQPRDRVGIPRASIAPSGGRGDVTRPPVERRRDGFDGLAGSLKLPISFGEDGGTATCTEVGGGRVADGAVKADVVVLVDKGGGAALGVLYEPGEEPVILQLQEDGVCAPSVAAKGEER